MYFFFFNDTATTEIYTLSLHDALPILLASEQARTREPAMNNTSYFLLGLLVEVPSVLTALICILIAAIRWRRRSEEHTSELQSRSDLVCRLLLEKKKKKNHQTESCNKI